MKPGDLRSAIAAKSEESDLKCNRFELEEALMTMYNITEDLKLSLDSKEIETVLKMHELRVDNLFTIFESMVAEGKIL